MIFFSSNSQQFGRPPGCVLNRLDVLPCNIQFPDRTDEPNDKYVEIIDTKLLLFIIQSYNP